MTEEEANAARQTAETELEVWNAKMEKAALIVCSYLDDYTISDSRYILQKANKFLDLAAGQAKVRYLDISSIVYKS